MKKVLRNGLVFILSLMGVHLLFYIGISEHSWFIQQGISNEAASLLTFLFILFSIAITGLYIFRDKLI